MSDDAYRGQLNSESPGGHMPIRPEAEQKLRAGFQRRVDRQADRYAAQLTDAEQLAVRLEAGEVAGAFSGQAGGGVRRGTYAVGMLPLAAIPVLIAGAAVGVPGLVPLLAASPFIIGAWFGLTLWRRREPKRRVWLYAFAQGCALPDGPRADAVLVRWSEVTEVSEVWTKVDDPSAEESRPKLTAYLLRCADGRTCEISRSLHNVRDPYPGVGPLLTSLMPADVGTTMPKFPAIDEVITAFAGKPGPRG
jgi:hypothetical protein